MFRNTDFHQNGPSLIRKVTAGHEVESEVALCELTISAGQEVEMEVVFSGIDFFFLLQLDLLIGHGT